jgi:hypothetical protein
MIPKLIFYFFLARNLTDFYFFASVRPCVTCGDEERISLIEVDEMIPTAH